MEKRRRRRNRRGMMNRYLFKNLHIDLYIYVC